MQYVKSAGANDLKDGDKKIITLDDKTILLVKTENEYFAIDNKCPHMGGSLGGGELRGYNIVCPRHGSAFDVRSGKLAEEGKILFVKIKAKDVKTYPVTIKDDEILIETD